MTPPAAGEFSQSLRPVSERGAERGLGLPQEGAAPTLKEAIQFIFRLSDDLTDEAEWKLAANDRELLE